MPPRTKILPPRWTFLDARDRCGGTGAAHEGTFAETVAPPDSRRAPPPSALSIAPTPIGVRGVAAAAAAATPRLSMRATAAR